MNAHGRKLSGEPSNTVQTQVRGIVSFNDYQDFSLFTQGA